MTIDSPGVKRSLPRPRCSCIIPFQNEQGRILRVLNVATRLNNLTQVICVDDGSTDDTSRQIVLRYPGVTLLRVPVKGGKAAAVRAGIDLVHTSHVLLLDADLRGLEAGEIGLAVSTALAHPEIDMIILRRVKAAIHARLSRGDVLFSGERILKTADLREVLALKPDQYQIEIAINRSMLQKQKRVFWMPSSARNTLKMRKSGPVRGLAGDVAMVKNMIDFAGVGTYVEQYLHFAREKAPLSSPIQSERPAGRR